MWRKSSWRDSDDLNLRINTQTVISKRNESRASCRKGRDQILCNFEHWLLLISPQCCCRKYCSMGPVWGKIPAGTEMDDDSVLENLHFHVRKLYSQQQCEERELLLLETECSVVQDGEELPETTVHMDLYSWHQAPYFEEKDIMSVDTHLLTVKLVS